MKLGTVVIIADSRVKNKTRETSMRKNFDLDESIFFKVSISFWKNHLKFGELLYFGSIVLYRNMRANPPLKTMFKPLRSQGMQINMFFEDMQKKVAALYEASPAKDIEANVKLFPSTTSV